MARELKETKIPDFLFSILVTSFLKIGFRYSDNKEIEVNEFKTYIDDIGSTFTNSHEIKNIRVDALFYARDYTDKIERDTNNILINYLRRNNFLIDSKSAVERDDDSKVLMTLNMRASICLNN